MTFIDLTRGPYNSAKPGEVVKTVLMPGYTRTYRGRPVLVMGSGMGAPSIGICSYELFAHYGVENIIRIWKPG